MEKASNQHDKVRKAHQGKYKRGLANISMNIQALVANLLHELETKSNSNQSCDHSVSANPRLLVNWSNVVVREYDVAPPKFKTLFVNKCKRGLLMRRSQIETTDVQ